MQLHIGTTLQGGKYRITEVLGQGSFGITYRAHHEFLDRTVAIKEFFMKELNSRSEDGSITGLSDGSLSYNYAQKFRKEAQNLAHLQHPNIVSVTDCFDENGTFYYVMDYIDGQNLNEYIKNRALSQDEAVAIIKEVAKALRYMHEEKHMLHLDLKPGNIMRRASDGHIFLIDFGLSKHYNTNGEPETSTTIGLGTAGYAPVEQGNQTKSGEFRPTIDVYALGATLFKLLTGETPPAASELISDDELIATRLKAHGVSEELVSAVFNAMLPNVKKRTQTISLLRNVIDNNVSIQNLPTNASTTAESKIKEKSEETIVIGQKDSSNHSEDIHSFSKIHKYLFAFAMFIVFVVIACLVKNRENNNEQAEKKDFYVNIDSNNIQTPEVKEEKPTMSTSPITKNQQAISTIQNKVPDVHESNKAILKETYPITITLNKSIETEIQFWLIRSIILYKNETIVNVNVQSKYGIETTAYEDGSSYISDDHGKKYYVTHSTLPKEIDPAFRIPGGASKNAKYTYPAIPQSVNYISLGGGDFCVDRVQIPWNK